MSRLDDYRSAMLAVNAEVSADSLNRILDERGPEFGPFVVDHGLGPLWHDRTKREEFHASRLSAEALYLAQERALTEIDSVLTSAGIEYVVIKGAASRVLLHANPAIRACHDLDLLVRPDVRVQTSLALTKIGFVGTPEAHAISRVLVLSRDVVNIDLHWGLLREGRLRRDPTHDMISRRRREKGIWMLNADDALFVLLVHPAFAKHLTGWDMGLHRVADVVMWLETQLFDRQAVCARLQQNGVQTAAWATLQWVELLTQPHAIPELYRLRSELGPSRLRKAWLEYWLRNDLSARTSRLRWVRLLGFSQFLHDTSADALRAFAGRWRARRRSNTDMAAFRDLFDE